MRVLHVTGCYVPAREWGGVPTAALGMVNALAASGVHVEVFTTTQRSSRSLAPIEPGTRDIDGVPVTYFRSIHRMGRAFFAPAMAEALWRRAREFDAVHLHMLWNAPGIVAANVCQLRGVPYCISIHGGLDPWALEQRGLEKRAFLAVTERRNLQRAGFLHFTFEAERALAPEWIRQLPAAIIPYAFDATPYLGLGDENARAKSFDVLILARVHPMKGFDVLIPAMQEVVAREPRARLVIAGPDEGGYMAVVQRLVADAGLTDRVEFTGYLEPEGRARALSRAALMVAPSHRENFCLSAAEGMAAGLPVVVSDKVNICDDVARAGAGFVVPLDSTKLATAILELLRDPARRARMGNAGRSLVTGPYAPRAVAAALQSAYESAGTRSVTN